MSDLPPDQKSMPSWVWIAGAAVVVVVLGVVFGGGEMPAWFTESVQNNDGGQ